MTSSIATSSICDVTDDLSRVIYGFSEGLDRVWERNFTPVQIGLSHKF